MFSKIRASFMASGGHSGGQHGVEGDHPPTRMLWGMGIALVIFLAINWVAGEQLLRFVSGEIKQEDLATRDAEIMEARVKEEAMLHDYDVVDQAGGRYKIPIENAIDALVSRNSVDPVTGGK